MLVLKFQTTKSHDQQDSQLIIILLTAVSIVVNLASIYWIRTFLFALQSQLFQFSLVTRPQQFTVVEIKNTDGGLSV